MKKLKSFLNKSSVRDMLNSLPVFSIIFSSIFIASIFIITLDPTHYYEGSFLEFSSFFRSYEKEAITFAVFSELETFPYALLPFLTGLSQYMFLHYKKQCYSVFSYPVNRKTIFVNRSAIPFIIIIAATVAIKLIALNENISLVGFSAELFAAWVINVIELLSTALISYTTAITLSILSGRYLEAAFAGLSLHIFPVVLVEFLRTIAQNTLYGGYQRSVTDEIYHFLYDIYPFSQNNLSMVSVSENINFRENLTNPTFISSVIYILLCVIILLLTKYFFINFYKPEKCGFKGTSKIINFLIALTPVTYAGAVVLSLLEGIFAYRYIPLQYLPLVFVIVILTMILSSIVISVVINFTPKKLKSGVAPAVALSVILVVFGGICVSDLFGTYNKLPEKDNIEEVYLSVSNDSYEVANVFTESGVLNGYLYSFTSSDDIDLCLDIYKSAIENRTETVDYSVDITFWLKNGSSITRTFACTNAKTVALSTKLWDSDSFRESTKKAIFPEKYCLNGKGEKATCDYDECKVLITSPYNASTKLTVSKEQFDSLRTAVAEDIKNISSEERHYPTAPQIGNLYFIIALSDAVQTDENYYSRSIHYNIAINGDMVKTIEVLKQTGLYNLFAKKQKVLNAYVMDLKELKEALVPSNTLIKTALPNFNGGKIAKHYLETENLDKLIDESKIDELIKDGQLYYLSFNKDMKVLVIEYENEANDYVVYLLPDEM